MDVMLTSVKWQCVVVYIDGDTIFFKLPEEHLKHIEEVLGLLMATGMTLKVKKCHFISKSINYLGHMISPGKLQVAKMATEAIESLTYPKNISQIWFFHGLRHVYRRFVPGFPKIVAPLKEKLNKGEPSHFVLDDQERRAIYRLRKRPVSLPNLDAPACNYTVRNRY